MRCRSVHYPSIESWFWDVKVGTPRSGRAEPRSAGHRIIWQANLQPARANGARTRRVASASPSDRAARAPLRRKAGCIRRWSSIPGCRACWRSAADDLSKAVCLSLPPSSALAGGRVARQPLVLSRWTPAAGRPLSPARSSFADRGGRPRAAEVLFLQLRGRAFGVSSAELRTQRRSGEAA